MHIGDDFVLDPIHIKGEGPKGKGIFADTSYADLPGDDSIDSIKKPGTLIMLAVLIGGLYWVAKS